HTDIIGHSTDGFPTRTAEEFVQFLHAIRDSPPGTASPSPVEKFLSTHPAALEFVQAPSRLPASFVTESYFGVCAYQFTSSTGATRFGRYRIQPEGANEYGDAASAAGSSPDYLFDEMKARLSNGSAKMQIRVQLAEPGDITDDSTVHWPKDRPVVDFGVIEL